MSHPWSGTALGNCLLEQDFLQATVKERVQERCLSSQTPASSTAEGAGQSPLPVVSQQIPVFAGALVQLSLNDVQPSPPLGTNSSTMAANKNSLPQILKSQIPFHQIYDSCRDPCDHRECRSHCSQDTVLVSASHALARRYFPKFYLERTWLSVTLNSTLL